MLEQIKGFAGWICLLVLVAIIFGICRDNKLEGIRDDINNSEIRVAELNMSLLITKKDVIREFERKRSIRLVKFPDQWNDRSASFDIKREAKIENGKVITEYLLSYPVEYGYGNKIMDAKVEATVTHNLEEDEWRVSNLKIPRIAEFR